MQASAGTPQNIFLNAPFYTGVHVYDEASNMRPASSPIVAHVEAGKGDGE